MHTRLVLLGTQSAKNTIFAFPKTFTIFYLRIRYFKVKIALIITGFRVKPSGPPLFGQIGSVAEVRVIYALAKRFGAN